ncbi:DUF6458 family protein [Microbacterium gorillae]|uniref:DUF6458 family protein n=1 Tax=Microbacterium gorillae TaxID=1231063 RepID=UPI003D978003
MSIGFGIFLFVVGAVLAFALNIQVDWIDLDLVGYLLMGAGVVITIIGIALLLRRRTTRTVANTTVDPASGSQTTRRETSAPDSPDVV